MKLHGNARTCPKSRRLLVDRLEEDWSLTEAAEAAGVSERTACKWLGRYRDEGKAGFWDRSSAPHSMPNRTSEARVEAICRPAWPLLAAAVEQANVELRSTGGKPMEGITPHSLRRTFVSLLHAAGADVPYVMAQAGHPDPKMT